MKRAGVPSILVAVVLLAVGVIAEAQQPKKVSRIGFQSAASPGALTNRLEAFQQGQRELVYVEGKLLRFPLSWHLILTLLAQDSSPA
jgi:putative ABC transport system substrate-binding protein